MKIENNFSLYHVYIYILFVGAIILLIMTLSDAVLLPFVQYFFVVILFITSILNYLSVIRYFYIDDEILIINYPIRKVEIKLNQVIDVTDSKGNLMIHSTSESLLINKVYLTKKSYKKLIELFGNKFDSNETVVLPKI